MRDPHPPKRPDSELHAAARRRVARLAWWLDNAIAIPGTRFRLGLDSVLGLIPGVGDVAGILLGGTILTEAYRAGVPNRLLVRMSANLAIDGVLGSVPLLGDLFDVAFRSHSRNAGLLLAHLDQERGLTPASRRGSVGLIVMVLTLLLVLSGLTIVGLVATYRHFAS